MTTWTNCFDAGACVVSVYLDGFYADGAAVWSGSMTKGDTQTFTDQDSFGSDTLTVAVDGTGVVTLSGTNDFYGNRTFYVDVQPVGAHTMTHVADVLSDANASMDTLAATYGDSFRTNGPWPLQNAVFMTPEEPPAFATPNPADDMGAPVHAGVYLAVGRPS